MPTKKDPQVENMKNISNMYCDVLSIVNIDHVKILDQMDAEGKRDFCKSCHHIFNDPSFQLIVQNLVFAQAMLVTEKGWDVIAYSNGQQLINGIQLLRETIWKYASIYETDYSGVEEDFDPHSAFSKNKIN